MRGLEIRLLTDIGIREGAGSELLSLLRERESGKIIITILKKNKKNKRTKKNKKKRHVAYGHGKTHYENVICYRDELRVKKFIPI